MRARSLLAVALLALPIAAEAQRLPRIPRIVDRGPARPAPLPPTAGPIAYERQYVRRPFTVESYPLVSYFHAPGFEGDLQQFITGGMGERLDFRVNRNLSFTIDLTQSFIGGPAVTQTAELGVRMRPESAVVRRWYPYVDVRGGFVYVAERNLRPYDYVSPTGASYYQAAGGFGGVAAGGIEYALHPRATLTTGASLMRANLAPFTDGSRQLDRSTLTAVRYSIGVRFNPGYWAPANTLQQRPSR
jgi:hypothetical protein